jgi:hypothetical protein
MLVLNEICDDYENLAISIEMPIMERGGRCGLYVDKGEIVHALQELVELGLARPYRLHGDRRPNWAEEMERMPSLEEMESPDGAWFFRTDAGLEAQLADWQPWPFDDDDELRKDWTPPES